MGAVIMEQGVLGARDDRAAGILFVDPRRHLVFLTLRSDEVAQPGFWGIPGGKVESGETPLEAAIRETREEVGSVPAHRMVGRTHRRYGSFLFTTFIAHVTSRVVDTFTPLLNEESSDAAWFKIDYLPSPMLPNVITVVGSLNT